LITKIIDFELSTANIWTQWTDFSWLHSLCDEIYCTGSHSLIRRRLHSTIYWPITD